MTKKRFFGKTSKRSWFLPHTLTVKVVRNSQADPRSKKFLGSDHPGGVWGGITGQKLAKIPPKWPKKPYFGKTSKRSWFLPPTLTVKVVRNGQADSASKKFLGSDHPPGV